MLAAMKKAALVLSSAMLAVSCGHSGAGDMQRQTFDANGVTIQYTVEGQGEPVVLIHGLYASAQLNWRFPGVIKALGTNYQIIAMDVRGHGGSGKPENESDYGIELEEDVVRLLDHLKIEKAHVVGYSMGGMITMKLLTRHPERVKSAVLGGMGWLREGSPLQEFWEKLPNRPSRGVTPRACPRSLGALAVTEDEVKAIKVPVMVVVGERDPVKKLYVVPLEGIRPDWPVRVVPDAGHLNCVGRAEFKNDLREWLDQQTRAGAAGK
jgi:pimeloyl-ACP methyl ester carboxylesterase